jgi:uncharacterized hydrophobic protein (TIGR00271 family)
MLHMRAYGSSQVLAEMGQRLEIDGAARNVALSEAVRSGHSLLTGDVFPESADRVLEMLVEGGVAHENIVLARVDDIALVIPGRPRTALIWADVLGEARRNSRTVSRFLVFMAAAGVIAGFGVIYVNAILIVGAMAVSPDTLPLTAACVGAVTHRWSLTRRALGTLLVGLGTSGLLAALVTVGLDVFDLMPAGFSVGESSRVLSGITTVNAATVGVALAAGVAGMLAVETRASSAVGVAISITTIPAAAYLGVAAAMTEIDKVLGAIAVLSANVVFIFLAGTTTLAIQRRLAQRISDAPGLR